MTPGAILALLGKLNEILTKHKVLDEKGNFVTPVSAVSLTEAGPEVAELLRENGVAVPTDLDKILAALPLILQLIGVK